MLKTIVRILVILLVVGLVAGGLYWIGKNHPSILGLASSRLGLLENGNRHAPGASGMFERGDKFRGDLPQGFPAGGMHLHEGGRLDSSRAWGGILINILIIVLITLLVVGIQKLYTWLFRRRKMRTV